MTRVKRTLDIVASAGGLAALSPLFLAIAAAIKLDDAGPVFFRQERVGLGGEPFRIWKFRTMTTARSEADRQLTVAGDHRVTRIGTWLRRFKLDELPQLLNVLRGEMSLVGPRPEVPRYVTLYTQEQRRVLELTPGLTDPASILYRNEGELLARTPDPERAYVEKVLPDKLRLNLEYAARATAWSDIGVILRTLFPRRSPAADPDVLITE